MFSSKVDHPYISNQDHNNHRPIIHIVQCFSSSEMLFVIICNQ